MRMGDWKAEAGGTTLGEIDPVLGDVTTSWGMGTCLFLYTTPDANSAQGRWGRRKKDIARVIPYYLVVFLS
jgi:hypothetical protein